MFTLAVSRTVAVAVVPVPVPVPVLVLVLVPLFLSLVFPGSNNGKLSCHQCHMYYQSEELG